MTSHDEPPDDGAMAAVKARVEAMTEEQRVELLCGLLLTDLSERDWLADFTDDDTEEK